MKITLFMSGVKSACSFQVAVSVSWRTWQPVAVSLQKNSWVSIAVPTDSV